MIRSGTYSLRVSWLTSSWLLKFELIDKDSKGLAKALMSCCRSCNGASTNRCNNQRLSSSSLRYCRSIAEALRYQPGVGTVVLVSNDILTGGVAVIAGGSA